MKYSGIGGQAVLEGVMMKNQDTYAVAVRLPNGKIEVDTQTYKGVVRGGIWTKVPIVRGVLNFIDSMVLGIKTLMYSATFFDEEEEAEWERERLQKEQKKAEKKAVREAEKNGTSAEEARQAVADEYAKKIAAVGKKSDEDTPAEETDTGKSDAETMRTAADAEIKRQETAGGPADPKAAAKASVEAAKAQNETDANEDIKSDGGHDVSAGDKAIMGVTTVISFIIAIAIFVILPYYLSQAVQKVIDNQTIITIFEGVLRLVIFIAYILIISRSNDIKRTYMYHGAEHKCINCIEHGLDLTVDNVRASSKEHKRCGTSFMMFVVVICIILYLFIRVDSHTLRIVIRLLLIPVIAGISYEILRAAGRTDNWFINIISKPGLWLQHLTTVEPDDSMIEVGIASVEAVFDWKPYVEQVRAEEAAEAQAAQRGKAPE